MSQALSDKMVNNPNVYAFPVRKISSRTSDKHHWDTNDLKSLLFGQDIDQPATARIFLFPKSTRHHAIRRNRRYA